MAQSKESEQAQKKQSMLSHKDKTIQVTRHIQGKANMKNVNMQRWAKERKASGKRVNITTM